MRGATKSAKWKSSSSLALIALVGVTAIWGGTFVAVKDAVAQMPVMDFLTWRFLVATVFMFVFRPRSLLHMTRKGIWRGLALGIVLGLGYITQTYGLRYASASISAFITGMFVVLTPVISWVVLRHKIGAVTWLMVMLATVGLGLISINGWSIGTGELLTLACAFFFAIHVVGLGEWSPHYDPYAFAMLQIAAVAGLSFIASVPNGIALPPNLAVWGVIGFTAVLATALAFLVQTWAQSLVSPTRAAVVMTMEPVFAGIFGVVIGGNQLTPRIIVGAVCILAATIIISLKSAQGTSRTEPGSDSFISAG